MCSGKNLKFVDLQTKILPGAMAVPHLFIDKDLSTPSSGSEAAYVVKLLGKASEVLFLPINVCRRTLMICLQTIAQHHTSQQDSSYVIHFVKVVIYQVHFKLRFERKRVS